ncbi:protein FAM124B [Perognathus longimembris pacificus]|uniref:protein FAM124B n=1 Tax=Perognathus longimembris pacificus TaxID=214514 RepID=UPI0020193C7D|nr:protein FAM124B [Perognathus longimembris pacificus]
MEDPQEPLAMTVHLLADSGQGSLLQQALDQLLDPICPEVRLFQVSERIGSGRDNNGGKKHARRSELPGKSVMLLLNASLGQARLFRIVESLRRPPWQWVPAQAAPGRPCPHLLAARQEVYSLGHQLPTWSVRQGRGGPDILRVTLRCRFENYEDAIRLYGLILQREAAVHKSTFCVFVLYGTPRFALQLSLKQLPPGRSVDPKESSVLQFQVQELGQLVPLLPNPCAPISRTRWRTQDYDGHTILLQVQLGPGLGVQNGELSSRAALESRLAAGCAHRTLGPRPPRSRSRRFRARSLQFPEPCGRSWDWAQPGQPGSRAQAPGEACFQRLEAETDVDTGFTIMNSQPFWSPFPRDLQASQPQVTSPGKDGPEATGTSPCPHRLPIQGAEKEEEEFFI